MTLRAMELTGHSLMRALEETPVPGEQLRLTVYAENNVPIAAAIIVCDYHDRGFWPHDAKSMVPITRTGRVWGITVYVPRFNVTVVLDLPTIHGCMVMTDDTITIDWAGKPLVQIQ